MPNQVTVPHSSYLAELAILLHTNTAYLLEFCYAIVIMSYYIITGVMGQLL